MKALLYNVWCRVVVDGKYPPTAWHVLPDCTDMERDNALKRVASGIIASDKYTMGLAYIALPLGETPKEDA